MINEVYDDAGTCLRCEKKLTDELSIERGYGPVCYQKVKEETFVCENCEVEKSILKSENHEGILCFDCMMHELRKQIEYSV